MTSDALAQNRSLVEQVQDIASRHEATPAQVALAWLLQQGDDVVPIPGTKRVERLEENLGALTVTLDDDDLDVLGALRATGDRVESPEWINRSTVEG